MPPKEELAAVLREYPWFMTARVLLAEAGGEEADALLALHRLSHPGRPTVPAPAETETDIGITVAEATEVHEAAAEESDREAEPPYVESDAESVDDETFAAIGNTESAPSDTSPESHSESFADEDAIDGGVIETFLSKGDYRIVPDENTPEDDAAQESSILDITDDMVSEELAEIYLAQGLNAQAKEIYARLSLLNPEKSVYFAEIIGKIDSGNEK